MKKMKFQCKYLTKTKKGQLSFYKPRNLALSFDLGRYKLLDFRFVRFSLALLLPSSVLPCMLLLLRLVKFLGISAGNVSVSGVVEFEVFGSAGKGFERVRRLSFFLNFFAAVDFFDDLQESFDVRNSLLSFTNFFERFIELPIFLGCSFLDCLCDESVMVGSGTSEMIC